MSEKLEKMDVAVKPETLARALLPPGSYPIAETYLSELNKDEVGQSSGFVACTQQFCTRARAGYHSVHTITALSPRLLIHPDKWIDGDLDSMTIQKDEWADDDDDEKPQRVVTFNIPPKEVESWRNVKAKVSSKKSSSLKSSSSNTIDADELEKKQPRRRKKKENPWKNVKSKLALPTTVRQQKHKKKAALVDAAVPPPPADHGDTSDEDDDTTRTEITETEIVFHENA